MGQMGRRIAAITLATSLTLIGGAVAAESASAWVCNTNQECLWSAANQAGQTWRGADNNLWNYGTSWYLNTTTLLWAGDGANLNVSSADSEDYARVTTFYYNSQMRGACYTAPAGRLIQSFTTITLSGGTGAGNANDRLGSHAFSLQC